LPSTSLRVQIAFVLAAATAVLTTSPPATPAKAQDLKMAQGVDIQIGGLQRPAKLPSAKRGERS
jgi:hypothetical protein